MNYDRTKELQGHPMYPIDWATREPREYIFQGFYTEFETYAHIKDRRFPEYKKPFQRAVFIDSDTGRLVWMISAGRILQDVMEVEDIVPSDSLRFVWVQHRGWTGAKMDDPIPYTERKGLFALLWMACGCEIGKVKM